MRKYFVLFIIAINISSCNDNKHVNKSTVENQDQLILSVLWYQKSAEMHALYIQGYNIAGKSLNEKLKNSPKSSPNAVIMDIDETILNNSPSEVYQILNKKPYSDDLWKKWVNEASAEPCPGALKFTKLADSLNVEVFYVTNRESPEEYAPTIQNLKKFGFPFADTLHLVLKNNGIGSKEARRLAIAKDHEILILVGDNLADFDVVFDKRGDDLGFGAVSKNAAKFGTDYIILPNPMYGSWINAAINNQEGKSTREKIFKVLKSF